ncbi:ribonuclease R [Phragmitibacter flavus]|uniref:Ribonuclease R n=1 Tax=Phragmitibacter flavus TaxID=2576071 RepID=A0A5R8KHQ5_9BACT|nr:ribonuclease R [Phragmitibacter flavus]TLD71853.1 ribonuclease R [Phragmitibacter flavus]
MHKQIINLLGRKDYTPSNVPEILAQVGLKPGQQQALQEVLKEMEREGKIIRTKGNRYIMADAADLISGVLQINRAGKGFLQPDEAGMKEIVVPENATGTALHGDRVLVRKEVRLKGLRQTTEEDERGTVVRILERNRSQLVGTLQKSKQFLFVIPDDPRIQQNIMVPPPKDVGRPANIGDKVVVELLAWESRNTNPEGEIIEVLGAPDEEGVDMLGVIRNYNLPLHFPKPVLDEANTIAKSRADNQPAEDERDGRVDCRKHQVITIDPDDAKDFDDAICVRRVSRDMWKLWVHIADVSHYVKPGSALDVEASKRGNSTYLVDRVIPMLPEALSNELCSLKPGLDRLTKCVEFDLSNKGEVLKTRFYPAVIHSKRRYTYKEALAIIEKPATDDLERMVHDANHLAQMIRKARFKAGSLDLDFPENKIRLDEQGKVLRIERMENDVSHQLIEEFMLLANEEVAGRLMKLRLPAVYRVHESPKPQRLQAYRDDVLGHKVACGDLSLRPEIQKLFERLQGLAIGQALKIGFLKSLMRARYAVEPLGHYGLNKAKYAHFTSPIRRYADLVVHRALFDKEPGTVASLKKISDHISATERNSADAERDSKDVKMYAYLKAQIKAEKRDVYEALVTDVRNFGFFVDVPALGMSGLVHLSSIQDDFYEFDPTRGNLTGRHTRKVIKLGDDIKVQVCRVDDFKKMVDFQLAGTDGGSGPAKKRGRRGDDRDRDRDEPGGGGGRGRESQGGRNGRKPEARGGGGGEKKFEKLKGRGRGKSSSSSSGGGASATTKSGGGSGGKPAEGKSGDKKPGFSRKRGSGPKGPTTGGAQRERRD